MPDLNHFDPDGNARMVDVGDKSVTRRMAKATGIVRMKHSTAEMIDANGLEKGDVLGTARLAGIMGTKSTPHLIPMCHPIAVDSVDISFEKNELQSGHSELTIGATVTSTGRTGVEMEALTAVTISALTVYDMCKSVDREIEIDNIRLLEKSGGKSGHFIRTEEQIKKDS